MAAISLVQLVLLIHVESPLCLGHATVKHGARKGRKLEPEEGKRRKEKERE